MKIIGIFLFVILLAAGGFLAWYYFIREGEVQDLFSAPYPKEALALRGEVEIHTGRQDFTVISAFNREDLFFAQGLHHGKRGGAALEGLRDLFHGRPNAGPDPAFSRLAELFYYLDLADTAERSLELYPMQVQVLLKAYADGLTQSTGTKTKWSVTDVLLMQRGYAFLMGRNLVREWSLNRLYRRAGDAAAEMVGYRPGEFGGLGTNALMGSALDALFDPALETVRLRGDNRALAVQTRTRPSLSFLFEPVVLEIKGEYTAEGIDLAGIPFLWSGSKQSRTWHLQAVLADDERFFELAQTTFLGRDDLLRQNTEARYAPDYPGPPLHSRYGRNISALIKGSDQMNIWYYWDGLRPSADLAALYFLMEAPDKDAVITAFQYHQVPAAELYLESKPGSGLAVLFMGSDPAVPFVDRGSNLFRGPLTRYRALQATRGPWFQDNRTLPLNRSSRQTAGNSVLDEDLLSLLRFYLRQERYATELSAEARQNLETVLKRRSPRRDFVLQQAWIAFDKWLVKEKVLVAPVLSHARKRYILASFGRGAGDQTVSMPQSRRGRIVIDILSTVHRTLEETPTFILVTKKGPQEKQLPEKTAVQSGDASSGAVFAGREGRLSVAGYTVIWQDEMTFWSFPYPRNGELGKPRLGNTMNRKTRPHLIKPKL
ncbi:MAG: penicillin acylase family protein [Acidobacteriota bacterium]|nr:penicillin acylase family protein [Acidobacteriota bacterium]